MCGGGGGVTAEAEDPAADEGGVMLPWAAEAAPDLREETQEATWVWWKTRRQEAQSKGREQS